MLTDGFEEASSPDDEFFGNSRILNLIRKHRKLRGGSFYRKPTSDR